MTSHRPSGQVQGRQWATRVSLSLRTSPTTKTGSIAPVTSTASGIHATYCPVSAATGRTVSISSKASSAWERYGAGDIVGDDRRLAGSRNAGGGTVTRFMTHYTQLAASLHSAQSRETARLCVCQNGISYFHDVSEICEQWPLRVIEFLVKKSRATFPQRCP